MVASKKNGINVAIVGGGISGIAQAVRLKERLGKKVKITVSFRSFLKVSD